MRDLDELFAALSRNKFRTRFVLGKSDCAYIREKSPAVIHEHARDFVHRRLTPSAPSNDGKQTPMRGHPVFLAQHATATCCRKCLANWHGIPSDRALTADEVDYVAKVIDCWISRQMQQIQPPSERQLQLFPPTLRQPL